MVLAMKNNACHLSILQQKAHKEHGATTKTLYNRDLEEEDIWAKRSFASLRGAKLQYLFLFRMHLFSFILQRNEEFMQYYNNKY